MGLKFRRSRYHKRVRIGKRTVKEGECAMVWDMWGRCKIHQGPQLVRLFFSDVRFCSQYRANEKQYLVVSYKNGKTEHIRGPTSLFENFLIHEEIKVKDAVSVKNDECLIVYTTSTNRIRAGIDSGENSALRKKPVPANKQYDKEVVGTFSSGRSIVFGPTLFFPGVNQVYETKSKKDKAPAPLALNLQHSQFTHVCSTKDNYNVTVSTSVRWKVKKQEVETFLDASRNPTLDLSTSLKIDLEAFTTQNLHDVVVQDRSKMCDSIKFRYLLDEAISMGIEIITVQMENFIPSREVVTKAQIEARKKEDQKQLEIQAEAERFLKEQERLQQQLQAEETERLEDMKLNMRIARAKKKAESEMSEVKHRQELLDHEHNAKLEREKKENQQKADLHRQLAIAKSDGFRARCAILKENGVDLTKYLVATATGHNKVIRKIQSKNSKRNAAMRRSESKMESKAEFDWDEGDLWVFDESD